MTTALNTEVLIIGAGPTGLMAANQLRRFGVDFIIVDKKSGPTKESRAIAVTARSLEIYQQMGLAEQAVQGGKVIEYFNLFVNGKRKAEVKIGEIGKGLSEFSFMLAFEQSRNEELLSTHLAAHGAVIHWNHEFVSFSQDSHGVKAVVTHANERVSITAQYLVACDGAGSPVRIQSGFSFKGGTYEHKFFVADAVMRWKLGYDKLIISPGDQNFCAFLPLKHDNTYRIIGTLPKRYFDVDPIPFSEIEKAVIHAIGVEIKFDTVNWFSTYKLHHRGVEGFRKGRVFLAGDSAHIHSPAGGQGMNTGLQDAYNLCWKLAFVLRNKASASLLDTYNEERLPFAKWLLRFTDQMFNAMTTRNWFIRKFRRIVLVQLASLFLTFKWVRSRTFNTISQIWYSYKGKSLSHSASRQRLSFSAGDRLPYFATGNIYPLFTKPSFHLLYIRDPSSSLTWRDSVDSLFPFAVEVVEEELSEKWKRQGVKSSLFILVRPDNYIAGIYDELRDAEIRKHLGRYFS